MAGKNNRKGEQLLTNMENDDKNKDLQFPEIPDYSLSGERRERTFPLLQTPDGRTVMLFDHEYRE